MPKYFLLLHEKEGRFTQFSPEEIQNVIEEYHAWGQGLEKSGNLLLSHKLTEDAGRSLSGSEEGMIVDGPFSETKEVIGGVFLIEAEGYDQAVDLCRDCPHLGYGGRIEVREVEI